MAQSLLNSTTNNIFAAGTQLCRLNPKLCIAKLHQALNRDSGSNGPWQLQWGVLSHLCSLQAQLHWPLYNVHSVAAFGLMGNSPKGHVRMASQTQKIKGEDDNPSATLWLPLPHVQIKTSQNCATSWCKHVQPATKFLALMTYIISKTKNTRGVHKGTWSCICQARAPVCWKIWFKKK